MPAGIWRPVDITRAYSNDLREHVVGAVDAGESRRAVADRFGVAISSVAKWHQRYRATGSVVPGMIGGHRKRVLEPHRAFIVEWINQTSYLTLHGLKAELAAHEICDRIEHALHDAVVGSMISIHVEPEDKAKHAGIVVL